VQVLLISGGDSLEPEERVCKYSAGSSDSNPIFLYSVSSLESGAPPTTVDSHFERFPFVLFCSPTSYRYRLNSLRTDLQAG
jgi:hypothetical protein